MTLPSPVGFAAAVSRGFGVPFPGCVTFEKSAGPVRCCAVARAADAVEPPLAFAAVARVLVPDFVPELVPELVPEFVPEFVPEAVPPEEFTRSELPATCPLFGAEAVAEACTGFVCALAHPSTADDSVVANTLADSTAVASAVQRRNCRFPPVAWMFAGLLAGYAVGISDAVAAL